MQANLIFKPPLPIANETSSGLRNTSAFFSSSFNRIEEEEEDIYLDEFSDEIDDWVIEALKGIGCATAKSVLALPRETLIEKADLEENTVDEVLAILKAEFEE